MDEHVTVGPLDGGHFVAVVPEGWGRVVRFEKRGDRILVHTESGDVMVLNPAARAGAHSR